MQLMQVKNLKIDTTRCFDPSVKSIAERFELNGYVGPITKIEVVAERPSLQPFESGPVIIHIYFSVPDAQSGEPFDGVFTAMHSMATMTQSFAEPVQFFGQRLDSILQEFQTHERHENLKLDGKFFIDPHPEITKAIKGDPSSNDKPTGILELSKVSMEAV
jgi:hypothetical protein